MQYDILLTKQPANGYIARPLLMPEIVVTGADEAEALARVREAIAKVTVQSRIVRIDVPIPEPLEDWVSTLAGSLGPAAPDEMAYFNQVDVTWQRFADEPTNP